MFGSAKVRPGLRTFTGLRTPALAGKAGGTRVNRHAVSLPPCGAQGRPAGR